MARNQAKASTQRTWRQAQGKRPQGIEKQPQPSRRSARLQEARQKGAKHSLPSPPPTNPLDPKSSHHSPPPEPEAVVLSCQLPKPDVYQKSERTRKRLQEVEASRDSPQKSLRPDTNSNRLLWDVNCNQRLAKFSSNRLSVDTNENRLAAEINDDQLSADISDNRTRRVATWLHKGSYPEDLFEPGTHTWAEIKADTAARGLEANGMNDLRLARKKSAADLRRQILEASTYENTDAPTEKTEDKSQPYRSPGYVAELEDQRSYMYDAPEGITDKSRALCQRLLNTKQVVPQDSLFHDDRFEETCHNVRDRNEARIVEDISPLIAPSPETLKTYGAIELKHLVFNADECWSNSRSITKTRPQPDGSVGFKRSAFTESQIQKLLPYIGNRVPYDYLSLFLATWRTFFPFFTREAKGGTGDLDIADRQNAHSMTMAVRGIVELFKLVHREDELHREIVTFSISHDATQVRLYGHYATINERVVSFWRHTIRSFYFTEQDGKEKWMAYQFTKNVYFESIAELLPLICSAIDQLPLSAAPSRLLSNPPQQIPLNHPFATDTDLDSQQPNSQEIAASTPGSQNPRGSKKRKLTGNAVLERQLDRKDEELERVRQEMKELRQSANSGNDSEVMTLLRQDLERQRQENERQREEHKREMDQLRDLLRQSLSA